MIPQAFDYERPASLEDALELLADDAIESVLLAGGHSLVPLMKLRVATPERLIDLRGIGGLDDIADDGGELRIGALATHAAIAASASVRSRAPLLAEAAAGIGDAQVRAWGTIGGSVATAHPAADWPAALIAAGAELVCRSRTGERRIAAREAFIGPYTSALEPDEVLTAVIVPTAEGAGGTYRKLTRPSGDYAVVGVGALLRRGADGTIAEARLGITGVGGAAFAADAAAERLVGTQGEDDDIEAAAAAVAEVSDAIGDQHASADYRRAMAAEMTRRAVRLALERCDGAVGTGGSA